MEIAAFPRDGPQRPIADCRRERLVEACLPIDTPMSSPSRLIVDLLLSTRTVTAPLSLVIATVIRRCRVSLSSLGTGVTDGGTRRLADGEGLDFGSLNSAEIAGEADRIVWRLMALDEPTGTVFEASVDTDALETVAEICLAASGGPEDAVHFDNLTMIATAEG